MRSLREDIEAVHRTVARLDARLAESAARVAGPDPLASSTPVTDALREATRRQAQRAVVALDAAVREALEVGCGVLVVTGPGGEPLSAGPDPDVPARHVYYVPQGAVEAFRERARAARQV